jgi:hypothetical protein
MKTENELFHKVAAAMAGCQRVEQYLKLYINEAYDFAKECIDGRMPFHFSGKIVENHALERLIEVFKMMTDDPELVRELRRFKDERNFLSHTAITHCYDYGGEFSDCTAKDLEPRLIEIEKNAELLVDQIHQHHGRLLVERHFENLEDTTQ